MKEFGVKLIVSAEDAETVFKMIDGMPRAEHVWDMEVINPDEKRFEERIRYVEDWCGRGEHFLFEGKYNDEDESEWGLDTAFPVVDGKIPYTALTKVRELMWEGTEFHFKPGH